MTVIIANDPTSQRVSQDTEELETFLNELAPITTRYMSNALFYIAGDFNSKLGCRKDNEEFIGRHSRGHYNINGMALADFLETHGLFVCNTAFALEPVKKLHGKGKNLIYPLDV